MDTIANVLNLIHRAYGHDIDDIYSCDTNKLSDEIYEYLSTMERIPFTKKMMDDAGLQLCHEDKTYTASFDRHDLRILYGKLWSRIQECQNENVLAGARLVIIRYGNCQKSYVLNNSNPMVSDVKFREVTEEMENIHLMREVSSFSLIDRNSEDFVEKVRQVSTRQKVQNVNILNDIIEIEFGNYHRIKKEYDIFIAEDRETMQLKASMTEKN